MCEYSNEMRHRKFDAAYFAPVTIITLPLSSTRSFLGSNAGDMRNRTRLVHSLMWLVGSNSGWLNFLASGDHGAHNDRMISVSN